MKTRAPKPAGPRCPTCTLPVKARAENAAFPFCSQRCQRIDLGRWLRDDYSLPAEEESLSSGPTSDPH